MSQIAEPKKLDYQRLARKGAAWAVRKFVRSSKVTPNRITIGGAVLALVGCVVWSQQLRVPWLALVGLGIVVISGLADVFDGAVAREKKMETLFGKQLDSVTDRAVDTGFLVVLAWVLNRQGHEYGVVGCVVACGGSVTVSYVRAKCESLSLKGDVGWGDRTTRLLVLGLTGLIGYWIGYQWGVYVLCALTWFTVGQRTLHMRQQLIERGTP